ncbi:MAG TPA: dihydroorotase [Halanaerobiales bacterium]|nr:dihydroorotase [Halanaerobiales bacterium]
MMKILIKNGHIIDTLENIDGKYDILLKNGKIVQIEKEIESKEAEIIDAKNKMIFPGLIDMHTHLREPGYEEKETIKTGAEAAAAGGFTTIACMPNTNPAIDNPATVEYVKSEGEKAVVDILPIGSITKKREGKELAELGFLAEAGVKAVSDDGNPVMNSEIMRRAMEYGDNFNLKIISHCEDLNLASEGVMNEGYYSTILGLKPIPAAAEETMIARDIMIAEFTGASLHIAHLSTKRGLELVTDAKKRGVNVSAEVTPHHFSLTDEAVKGYDPNTKVNPPLRSQNDVDALKEGIAEGTIDIIATDHAPHTYEDKLGEFNYAANGISGLETALALVNTNLVKENIIDYKDLLKLMYEKPIELFDLKKDGIKEGVLADLIIFDPDKEWEVKTDEFKSKGKNTPFAGQKLTGKNEITFSSGKLVYDNRGDKAEILCR